MNSSSEAATDALRNPDRLFREALSLHESGKLEAARPLYECLLDNIGPNPDILHLYGTLLFQSGVASLGARCISKAILQRPDAGSYYDHLGSAARAMGRAPRSMWAYERACIVNPQSGTAFLNAAIVHLESDQADIAVKRARRATELLPQDPATWLRLGSALRKAGRLQEALPVLEIARARAPDLIETYFHLKEVQSALGATRAADTASKRGIMLAPQQHEFYANFRDGDISDVTRWRGETPRRLAVVLQPAAPRGWDQLASSRYGNLDYPGALSAAKHAILLAPELAPPYNSLGTAAFHLGDFTGAIRAARYGLAADPNFGDIGYNLSLSAFSAGKIELGWRFWGHRLKMRKIPGRIAMPPRWTPERGEARHLLVASEQGIGDDIAFLSCLPDLLGRAEKLTVETDTRLHPLLKRTYPEIDLIEKQLRASQDGSPAYDYSVVCSERDFSHAVFSGDLPAFFRRDASAAPAPTGALQPDPELVRDWKNRLGTLGPGPYFGLCWRSGTLLTGHRRTGYLTAAELVGAIPNRTFTLINLQYGDATEELLEIRETMDVTVHDFADLDQVRELDRVAALMSCLDLVVAPATAALALACSVGVPVIGLEKSYFRFGDGWDPLFGNLLPVRKPSEPTLTNGRAARMGAAVRHFIETGSLPIRKP
ncbi:tetratricopeptide repeat protein [Nisaea sp.]|uniref:tetratricopeptide repeat protein n=1 Tax=Nisaea sp. TaxID=2024842 RepID=UPI0025CE9970|nr:tetratricopeptide repeat protein [Nisaea sp.]